MPRSQKEGQIYFIQECNNKLVKIGIAKKAVRRLQNLQGGLPFAFDILAIKKGTWEEEFALHLRYQDSRVNGEWFKPSEKLMMYIREVFDQNVELTTQAKMTLEETKSRTGAKEWLKHSKNMKLGENLNIEELFGIEVLLTIDDFATILQVTPNKIKRWISEKRDLPPTLNFYGHIRFRKTDVKKWFEEMEQKDGKAIAKG